MSSGILNRISNFTENEKVAFKKKALIFGFFLIISIGFWFINILNKKYIQEVSYPVIYKNFPSQKVQVGNPPENLELKVMASGYTLLWFQLSSKYIPISFSVNLFTMHHLSGHDSSDFFITTNYAKDYISNQLIPNFEIITIRPDTLFFQVCKYEIQEYSGKAGIYLSASKTDDS